MKNIMLRFGKKQQCIMLMMHCIIYIYVCILLHFFQPFLKVHRFRIHSPRFEVISYSAAISACEKGNRSFAIDQ